MDTALPFVDRRDAAIRLARALAGYRDSRPLVLAIPRGGVPMGRIIADMLGGDLDVVLVRKIGAPGNPEFAIGAIDEDGRVALDETSARLSGATPTYVELEARRQLASIRERRQRYSGGRQGTPVAGRTVIVVDDGLATGATMNAALRAIRDQRPARLICAVPVGAQESVRQAARIADEVVCLATPSPFGSVGHYYRVFDQVEDETVVTALHSSLPGVSTDRVMTLQVRIQAGLAVLNGDLSVPGKTPKGLVIFAHGSGSSRFSARNRMVAEHLNRSGFATLLFDLLTPQEEGDRTRRFDIPLLAHRLQAALDWSRHSDYRNLPIALFGASTGAAAALTVVSVQPRNVVAVISRGGRPDLAGQAALSSVRVPTLLIVGGADPEVLQINRAAKAIIGASAELVVVPGATHLFEEHGALEQVADLSTRWLTNAVSSAPLGMEQP